MKDTTQNNKLLAEFLSRNYNEDLNIIWNELYEGGERNPELMNDINNYKYFHNSWDWLMLVVEKIESLEFDFAIYTGSCVSIINTKDFPYDEIINLNGTSKIESVYNACIDFIKWYNENSAGIKN